MADAEPRLLQLPADVLKGILSSLSEQDRIGGCASVCQQLGRAAAALTDALLLQSRAKAHAYLEQHGHFLTRLEVKEWGEAHAPPFPCHNLRHLDLQDGVLRLVPARSSLTALTELGLTNMSFGSTRDVDVLRSNMTSLQELSIMVQPRVEHDPLATSTLHVLPPFARLTRLELQSRQVTDAYLQHLGRLTELRSLCIEAQADTDWDASSRSIRFLHPGVTPAAFSGVTSLQQLTSLELEIWRVDERMCPFFASLTALRSLRLPWLHHLEPIVLTALTQLHEFSLGAAEMDHTDEFELLELLPMLQQLRVLKFSMVKLSTYSAVPAAAFSALTASSNLQQLIVEDTDLVDGAWAHVFPSSRQFSQLTELRVEGYMELGEPTMSVTPFSPDEFRGFAQCCPGLRSCRLHGFCAAAAPHLTALQQLGSLTRLVVGLDDDADMLVAVAGIGALTQLVDLHVEGIGTELDPLEGLRALTALKQLTQLSYVQHCRDEEAERGWGEHDLLWENEAPPGSPPDVWQQVMDACNKEVESRLSRQRLEMLASK